MVKIKTLGFLGLFLAIAMISSCSSGTKSSAADNPFSRYVGWAYIAAPTEVAEIIDAEKNMISGQIVMTGPCKDNMTVYPKGARSYLIQLSTPYSTIVTMRQIVAPVCVQLSNMDAFQSIGSNVTIFIQNNGPGYPITYTRNNDPDTAGETLDGVVAIKGWAIKSP
ncbi:MAG: hypothetical protein M1334_01060 [Patescibacteria group bacterium]|nr:hypothetical protein [Patescibacteria group bacterium]